MLKKMKINMSKRLIAAALGMALWNLNAQDSLKLEDVVSKTLSSNFQISVAQIQTKQAGNLATRGQAGFFPQISGNGIGAFSQNNTKLEFAGGLPDVERKGAINTQFGANIGLNYTVFNGFGRVYTYKNLVQQYQLSQIQAKLVAENLVFEAVNRFVNIQQARVNADLAKANLELSNERLIAASKGYESGAKLKLDVLAAELDVYSDSLVWLQAKNIEEKEGYGLNVIMGEAPLTSILISQDMPIPVLDGTEKLIDKVRNNGSSVLLAKWIKENAQMQANLAQSRMMPSVNVSANYGFLNAQNGAGIILAQTNTGFNSTASLVVPIFNGNQLRTALKNADLEVERRSLEWKQSQLQAEQMVFEALADQNLLETQILTQIKALSVALKAWDRAKEAYAIGQIRFTDLRASQISKLQAESNVISSQLNLLRLRYSIKRLTGELLD
jgi:outer membrane protein